ncbi:YbaB/EbfC family nucleoid-associated protein [Nocardia sp. alder85J]|uniref:YbaB/EbfC family nucleoid-associated protein n=1 Tax=Nocardia sp. alder85J TaxID=2862949 RepID=UPI001CD201BD|nr:YbaB/EbfC family nucleoid-associated protein [Nocardia sp. alder85J]MCX4092180.1 YbaB/EbfC family nucleoid-associated protein [Nocardia sp. alder85J]
MDRWEREGLRSANNGLRNQIDHVMDDFERQRDKLGEVFTQLENLRLQATSQDDLAEVVVDGSGVVAEVRLSAAAMRSTPEQLGRSITEAARAAAGLAAARVQDLTAELTADLETLPDLPDFAPEAPSLREVRDWFRGTGPQ